MNRLSYEKLDVYRLAEELADAIWDVVLKWDGHAKSTVGRQMIRAADSVGANIAEGAGAGTAPEHRRFIRIARRSLNETRFWLRRAYHRKLIPPDQVDNLSNTINELAPRLNAYLKSIDRTREPEVPYDTFTTDTHEILPQAPKEPDDSDPAVGRESVQQAPQASSHSEQSERPTAGEAGVQQQTK